MSVSHAWPALPCWDRAAAQVVLLYNFLSASPLAAGRKWRLVNHVLVAQVSGCQQAASSEWLYMKCCVVAKPNCIGRHVILRLV